MESFGAGIAGPRCRCSTSKSSLQKSAPVISPPKRALRAQPVQCLNGCWAGTTHSVEGSNSDSQCLNSSTKKSAMLFQYNAPQSSDSGTSQLGRRALLGPLLLVLGSTSFASVVCFSRALPVRHPCFRPVGGAEFPGVLAADVAVAFLLSLVRLANPNQSRGCRFNRHCHAIAWDGDLHCSPRPCSIKCHGLSSKSDRRTPIVDA
jgi:hypothetical protein